MTREELQEQSWKQAQSERAAVETQRRLVEALGQAAEKAEQTIADIKATDKIIHARGDE